MSVQTRTSQPRPKGVPKLKPKQDEAIISTNDYSIVSKRSVEKLYYRDEPEFLRAFVNKYKRRAPLINRGYWLRMRAIEAVVTHFLDENARKSKAIVNLGCGYEPLAFRMLWKYPKKCHNVKFIDIDFPQLIQKKFEVIKREAILNERLDGGSSGDNLHPSVILSSQRYSAVGCDLGDNNQLQSILKNQLELDDCAILFIGEVSIVYMPPQEATDLIRFCSTFNDARICILEQHLPSGKNHPFVKTMIDHFNKQTPLRGLSAYNTIESQRYRFLNVGWHDVQTTDLWSLWQNNHFIDDVERVALDSVEPFDEWDGLALFAGHYFLLVATTSEADASTALWRDLLVSGRTIEKKLLEPTTMITVKSSGIPKGYGRVHGVATNLNEDTLIHCGGTANSTRQGSTDIYALPDSPPRNVPILPANLSCSTITSLGNGGSLYVGGRASPLRVSTKCFMLENNQWTATQDLDPGRYKHCAAPVSLGGGPGVLVFGGKTGTGEVLDQWALFLGDQWHEVIIKGDRPGALFGASMTATGSLSGVLTGGLNQYGRYEHFDEAAGYWQWVLQETTTVPFQILISFVPTKDCNGCASIAVQRFGSVATITDRGVLVVGGVGSKGSLQRHEELVLLKEDGTVLPCNLVLDTEEELPMFIGHSVVKASDHRLIIVGGGTVCFSFGAFWNNKVYTLLIGDYDNRTLGYWKLHTDMRKGPTEVEVTSKQNKKLLLDIVNAHEAQSSGIQIGIKGAQIPRTIESSATLQTMARHTSLPVVIENFDLGPCTNLWTPEYLIEKVGPNKPTIIHSSSTPHLSFHTKNFTYKTVPFHSFISAASSGSNVYMRALSTSNSSRPAALCADYPSLAADFLLPRALDFASQFQHSSVLRISGNVNMWLHYDVMSNILCQISGSKRILLFPPSSVSLLDFPAGQTTSNLDVFAADPNTVRLANCAPLETTLSAGEILFIPACWPHATTPAPQHPGQGKGDLSVAVNVFFRSFEDRLYAAGRDVYGNRDLEMYQNGRKHVAKICDSISASSVENVSQAIKALAEKLRAGERVVEDEVGGREVNRIIASAKDVPDTIANFYLTRLADELLEARRS